MLVRQFMNKDIYQKKKIYLFRKINWKNEKKSTLPASTDCFVDDGVDKFSDETRAAAANPEYTDPRDKSSHPS